MRARVAWLSVSTCPDPSALDAFVRGDLPWGTRLGIEGHIDACPECAAVISEMARLFGSSLDGRGVDARSDTLVPDPRDEAPHEGVAVGRYRLGPRLGAGAMGMVFEAHDPQLQRRVAIKLLHPHVAAGPDGARLLREARAMAQLSHPNVVAVHDAGRADSQVFVAMERVHGETLGEWLKAASRSQAEILGVFVQAGRGLEAAHAVGIVHRDFKPDNVMVGEDGRARVADFGLARPSRAWMAADPSPAEGVMDLCMTIEGLTEHGAIVGTPAYMSPEQWAGAAADARSDQFAFCVALFEAVAGHRPFAGRTLAQLASSVDAGRVEPMRSVPGWLRRALEIGLARDPARRHPSMTRLLRVLERDRSLPRRVVAVAGAMAIGAAATVGVLRWMAEETTVAAAPVTVAEATPDVGSVSPPAGVDDEACRLRAQSAAGSWNAPRRAAFIDGLRRAGPGLEERTVPLLDRWVSGYAKLAGELCDARPPRLAQARTRCLQAEREAFDALLTVANQQERWRLAQSVTGAAYALPDVLACAQESRLLALPAETPAAQQGAVRQVRADVASARALAWLGAFTDADAASASSLAQARAVDHAPTLAEALLVRGEVAHMRGETDVAIAALTEAVTVAEGAEATWVRGVAATLLLRLHGAHHVDTAQVPRWRRVTGAFVERLGDPFVTASVMVAEAEALQGLLELNRAKTLLTETLEIHRELYSDTHPLVAAVRQRLAEVLLELEEDAAAREQVREAVRILEITVGSGDLQTVAAHRLHARTALALGDLPTADAEVEHCLEGLGSTSSLRHDAERGWCLLVLGDVRAADGALDEAKASYERAKIYHYTGRLSARPVLRLSALALRRGDAAGAVARAQEAVVIQERELSTDDVRRTLGLRALATAQQAGGDLDAARAASRSVRALVDAQVGFGPLQSRSLIELADLERAAGNDAVALELYDDAHVSWVTAYGLHHRFVTELVLSRADLAWGLGKRDYARRLYGTIVDELQTQRGVQDAAAVRASTRSASR